MSKTEAAVARLSIVEKAQVEIAFCKGQIARAYNRPRSGVLVPKTETQAEHDAWVRGWDSANAELG